MNERDRKQFLVLQEKLAHGQDLTDREREEYDRLARLARGDVGLVWSS